MTDFYKKIRKINLVEEYYELRELTGLMRCHEKIYMSIRIYDNSK